MGSANRTDGVSFVFCDLVGSTSILSALGEARSDELRRDLFEALRQPLRPFLGEEVKSQGDGLMVAFRNSVADAIGCAIVMQQAVATLSCADDWPAIEIRVGVSSGEVTAEDGDWFGTPVVEAARLCGLAGPRQILIAGHAVPDGVAQQFGLRPVGSLSLKGFPEPVECVEAPWNPVANGGIAPVPPALVTSGHPPSVGLDRAIAEGLGCFDATVGGAARGLIVSGRPRSGRTRFIAELAAAAQSRSTRPVAVLYGSGALSDQPFAVIVEALRRFTLWAPLHVVAPLTDIEGLSELVPALPFRLGRLPPPNDGPLDADLVVEAVARAVEAISRVAPTILALDDIEGCDVATLEVIGALMTSITDQRLLTIVSSRTTELGDRPAFRAFVDKLAWDPAIGEVEVPPLDRADHRRLVAATVAIPADVEAAMATDIGELVEKMCGSLAGDVVEAVRHVQSCGPLTNEHQLRSALSSAVPYKGLVALGDDDESVFFGRRPLVDALVERLAEDRFVMVTGASGSGKSSTLSAGLVNVFRRLGVASVVTSPSDPIGIAAVLDNVRSHDGVVIDQFEELFTLWDPEPRRLLLDRVLDLVERDSCAWVAIAMRSDFFGACAEHAGLLRALDDHTVLVGSLTDEELREVVEGPADAAALVIEPALADLVIADLAHEANPLPLLSHALFETWRRRRDDHLTVANYRETGGLRRSIAYTADRIYTTGLDPDGQTLARSLLLRLVDFADDRPPTRRPLSIEHLHDAFGSRIGPVLDQLVAARLLVAHDRFVDLAHEALITEWPRFAEWIDHDRDRLRTLLHLSHATAEWDAGDRSTTDLYRGARLDAAFQLIDGGEPVTPSERAYVEASMTQREAEGRRLRRTNKRLRRQLVGAVIALVVAVGATTVAVVQQRHADRQRQVAELDALNGAVVAAADTDVALSSLLAVEARRLRPDGQSLLAMNRSLRAQPSVLRIVHPSYITSDTLVGATSPDGLTVALLNRDEVTLVDTTTLDIRNAIGVSGAVAADYSPDGVHLAVATASNVTIVDAAGVGAADYPVDFESDSPIHDLAWSDASHVWATSTAGAEPFQILDTDTGVTAETAWKATLPGPFLIAPVPDREIMLATPGVEFDSNGNVLGETGSVQCCLRYLDAATGEWVRDGPVMEQRGAYSLQVLGEQAMVATAGNTLAFDLDEPYATDVTVSFLGTSGLWRSADGSLAISDDDTGHVTLYDAGQHPPTPSDVAILPPARDLFVRADMRTAFLVADDHLIEVSLTGREPLSTETFGRPRDIPYIVSDTGDSALSCAVGLQCQWIDPNTDEATDSWSSEMFPILLTADESAVLWYVYDPPSVVIGSLDGDSLASDPVELPDDDWWWWFPGDRRTMLMGASAGGPIDRRSMVDGADLPTSGSLEPGTYSAFAASNDGLLVAAVAQHDGRAQTLSVIDIVSGRVVLESTALPDSAGRIEFLAFSADNTRLSLGDRHGNINEFELATGTILQSRQLRATGGLTFLWQSLDGAVLFSVTADGSVRWWDLASGTEFLPILVGETAPSIQGLDRVWISFLNRFMAVAGVDGWRQWNFSFDTWPDIACDRAGRNLTLAEWETYLPPDEAYHVTCPNFPPGT